MCSLKEPENGTSETSFQIHSTMNVEGEVENKRDSRMQEEKIKSGALAKGKGWNSKVKKPCTWMRIRSKIRSTAKAKTINRFEDIG